MILLTFLGFCSFLLALVLTPFVRDRFRTSGFVDLPNDPRKIHSRPIPRVGGIAIMASYVICFVLITFIPFNAWQKIQINSQFVTILCIGTGVVFISGLLDDFYRIRPWQKLLAQAVASLFMYHSGLQIKVSGMGILSGELLSGVITIIWLVGCTNAFNLIDGMDGLATGVGLFATITALIAAIMNQNFDLMLVTIPLAGGLLGFLRYNFNPASIFLGDCGSMSIGFLLACFAIEWSNKAATLLGLTAPIMAMVVPLMDVMLSIGRRFVRNQPIFRADRGHIHHRLLDRGLTQRQAAMVAYAFSGLAAVFALLQSAYYENFGGLIILLFGLTVWVGIQNLGYLEFGLAGRLLFRGGFTQMVDFQMKLKDFESKVMTAQSLEAVWKVVKDSSKEFGFHGVRMQLYGRVFSEVEEGYLNSIQIRIPLLMGNYVNFHGADGQINSVVLNSFLPAVANTLNTKFSEICTSPQASEERTARPKLAKLG